MTQLVFSMFMVAYVYILWPFKDDTQNKLDMFNELSTMMLIYFAYMFTDLCPSAEDQYFVGYFFIVILAGTLLTHLTLIGISTVKDLIEVVKEWIYKCKNKLPIFKKPAIILTIEKEVKEIKQKQLELKLEKQQKQEALQES